MTKISISKLLEVAEKATPGPWEVDECHVSSTQDIICDYITQKANREHVANFSPDTAQAILRALREARAAMERVRNGLYHGFISEQTASDRLDIALAKLSEQFEGWGDE